MDTKKILIAAVIIIIVIIVLLTSPFFKKPAPEGQKLPYINELMSPIDVYFVLGEELMQDCNTEQECFVFKKESSDFCSQYETQDNQLKCKAFVEFNPAHCEDIQNENIKNECIFHLTNEVKFCKKMTNTNIKNKYLAEYYNSEKYCQDIEIDFLKGFCLFELSGNISTCPQGMEPFCEFPDTCKEFEKCFINKTKQFTISTEDHKFCRYIPNMYLKGLCFKSSKGVLS